MSETANPVMAARFASASTFQVQDGKPPSEIVVFPAGIHAINAHRGDGPVSLRVCVDSGTASAMQASLNAFKASSPQRPYLDFDHEEKQASAWPTSFSWVENVGVVAAVEWSEEGSEAVVGKNYRAFSPAFFVDASDPARVTGAPFVMGGLVNDPAFRAIPPIWAKDASTQKPNTEITNMSDTAAAASTAANEASNSAATAELDAVKASLASMKQAFAKEAVKAALAKGSIKQEDSAKWESAILANDSANELLEGLPAIEASAAKVAPAGVFEVKANIADVFKAMSSEKDAKKRGAIYCRDARNVIAKANPFEVQSILAANSLGSLVGDLIVLRSLDLLKFSFPVLSGITTDFSDAPVNYGQNVKTRIISVPSVGTYSTSTGYASTAATTSDVSVSINNHKFVQIEFNANELASTNRDLFGEQVEAMHYAMGLDLTNAIYGVVTSTAFSLAGQKTVKAAASMDRATAVSMEKALTNRGVPPAARTLILNPDYFESLAKDSTIVQLATFQKPEVITGTDLPPIAGFRVLRAPNLPATAMSTGTLGGMGFTKDALVLVTRLPNDYTQVLPGANYGSVGVVTNPDTGISVQKVDYVNHDLGKSVSRIAWMFGVGAGQTASLQYITTA